MYIVAVLLLLFAVNALAAGKQCTRDYECGNVPFTLCKGGADECFGTIGGLALDKTTNQLYFAQTCRVDYETYGYHANTTIKRVSASGGSPVTIKSYINPYKQPSISTIEEVFGNKLYFVLFGLQSLDLQRPYSAEDQRVQLPNNEYYQSSLDFDASTRQSYVCSVNYNDLSEAQYHIYKFNGIIGQDSISSSQLLYSFGAPCSAVRASGDSVYFSTFKYSYDASGSLSIASYFYKGSKTCSNCTNPQLLFTVLNDSISDFVITNNKIYFTSSNGVYSCDLNGQNLFKISGTTASGIQYLNSKIYWNNFQGIYSAALDGSNIQQVNLNVGTCGCASGFTGTNCATCTGQTQWYGGKPNCVSIGSDGYPVKCRFDYECGNQPFTACYEKCSCKYGFTGSKCNQCTNSSQTITWQNNYPVCS